MKSMNELLKTLEPVYGGVFKEPFKGLDRRTFAAKTSIQDRMLPKVDFTSVGGRAQLAHGAYLAGNAQACEGHRGEIVRKAESEDMTPEKLKQALFRKANPAVVEKVVQEFKEFKEHLAMKQLQSTPNHGLFSVPPVAPLTP